MLKNPLMNLSFLKPGITNIELKPDRLLNEGDVISAGAIRLEVIHTPGHSKGSICLLGDGYILTGDTLFEGSIGRTDLPGGSYESIITSVKNKLKKLPDELKVYPGHGPASTIGEEKVNNPFM
jgi:glyoxylase-like metal-dependent hydrolase (beta-lactamase superfamily II)